MNRFRTTLFIFCLSTTIIALSPIVKAQATPDEHSQHHPEQPMSPIPTATPTNSNNTNGTMPGGMGEMMNEMHNPPGKELYPALIELPPDLPPEKRDEIAKLADERINEGNALVSLGFGKLANANQKQDFAAMREAIEEIRRGQTLLESGLAARRALAENKSAPETALNWFKREMNLAPAVELENPHGFFGLSWFHYASMLTLAAFSAAMIWMYFRKMKRAGALVARLSSGSGYDIPLSEVSTSASLPPASTAQPVAVNLDIAPSKSNSWSGTLLVAKIFEETPQVKTFRLTDPSGGKLPFNFLPGQFVTVTVAPKGVPVKRSYTIASSPTKRDYCEITVKHEERGTVSHYLNTQVHEAELLQLVGPSGRFTFTGEESGSVVLIAGGVGVTPMMSVIRYLTDRSWKNDIFFFFGCKSEKDIIYREEIEYLEKRYPNLHVSIILGEAKDVSKEKYLTGNITKELLLERVPEIASRRVHICGPPPMMDAIKRMLAELEVPEENVKTEIFAGKLPSAKPSAPAPDENGKTAVATFVRSKKTAVLTRDKTILEASEEVGVNIDYSCRVGTCGICKTKLLSGKVTMDIDEALSEEDKANNVILACQAKGTTDVSVDA